MPYLVYNPTSRLIAGGYRLNSEAIAAAAADASLAADNTDRALPADFNPGWFFTTADAIVPELAVPNTSIVELRRNTHKQLMRGLEQIPGLAAWASQNDLGIDQSVDNNVNLSGPLRAKFYTRWVELNTRYGSVDSNLLDDDKWAKLLGEASIPGRFWYVHYELNLPPTTGMGQWAFWLSSDNRAAWSYYYTTGPIAPDTATTPNSYKGAAWPMDSVPSDFDWINYLSE